MSSSIAPRQARHLFNSAAAAAASSSTATFATAAVSVDSTATTPITSGITASKAKSKLKAEFDPDKAFQIYSSLSNHYTSPVYSRYAQDLTVKRLASSRRFDDIEKLLEAHKENPKIKEEPYLSTLIRSYGLVGMTDHALKTYHQLEELGTPRSTISFNALLSAYIQSSKFDDVLKLFEEMPKRYGFSPCKISYGVLVKSFCEAGQPDSAMETLKEMEMKKIEITNVTYTTIMSAFYKQGKAEEGEKIWDEMVKKGYTLDATAHNVRLMHASGGDPESVKELIDEMTNSGIKPDTISYNYLMTSYCKAGKMDEAKEVYNKLEEYGCKPNATTFRALIFHMSKHGRFVQGYRVFKNSVKFNKIPNFGTLQHLMRGLVKPETMKEAKGMSRTIKKKFPPNVLNAWAKLEKELGLYSDNNNTSTRATTTTPAERKDDDDDDEEEDKAAAAAPLP
ncbi:pentatricopeptide repeat-containing protein At4g36680, mitochondrial-like [Impatiens glandulifera]|uniref:pentatricopeptide repeat-containing protein At4g36680, mitochondrial-like n=1 Tax=Impatiens glandulifera TaxID=253017 RepID=UPI001FB093AB|nr:pentatricopeptide repeat-containing protein At4g36680, mitochondrial-like [Impatiens glandulifera]